MSPKTTKVPRRSAGSGLFLAVLQHFGQELEHFAGVFVQKLQPSFPTLGTGETAFESVRTAEHGTTIPGDDRLEGLKQGILSHHCACHHFALKVFPLPFRFAKRAFSSKNFR
jgi:hypothetical protein